MRHKVVRVLFCIMILANFAGCKPVFDMAVYEDSLLALDGSGGNIQATSLLNQSIVSSELVSARIPPGVYADYGTLLYREGKIAEAVEQITKEEALYPESKQFIQRLLAVLKRTKADQVDSVSSQYRTPSILILPPINKSGRPEAGTAFELTLNRQIVERGYYVFPVLATTVLFQDGGMKPADIQGVESSFLKELTGADGLLYVTITEWQNTWFFSH